MNIKQLMLIFLAPVYLWASAMTPAHVAAQKSLSAASIVNLAAPARAQINTVTESVVNLGKLDKKPAKITFSYLDFTGIARDNQKIIADYLQNEWYSTSFEQPGKPAEIIAHDGTKLSYESHRDAYLKYQGNFVAFSPCGTYFASVHNNGIFVRDRKTGNIRYSIEHTGVCRGLQFAPNSKCLAFAIKKHMYWLHLDTGIVLKKNMESQIRCFTYTRDSDTCAICVFKSDAVAATDCELQLWHIKENQCDKRKQFSRIGSLRYDANAKAILGLSHWGRFYMVPENNFEAAGGFGNSRFPEGQLFRDKQAAWNDLQASSVLKDYGLVIGNHVKFSRGCQLDRATFSDVYQHDDAINTLSISPDGKYVASGSSDSTVKVFDLEKSEEIGAPLDGHTGAVLSVAFSPMAKNYYPVLMIRQ